MTMHLVQWAAAQLNVKANAPRWAGLAVAALVSWLASGGIDLPGEVQAGLIVTATFAITTVVQKLATWPRADLIDHDGHRPGR